MVELCDHADSVTGILSCQFRWRAQPPVINNNDAASSTLCSGPSLKRFRLGHSNLSQLLHECDWVHCIREEMDAVVHSSALGDQPGNGGCDDSVHPVLAASRKGHLIAMRDLPGITATLNLNNTKTTNRQGLREQSRTHSPDSEGPRKRQQRDQRSNDCGASTRQIGVGTPIAALKPRD